MTRDRSGEVSFLSSQTSDFRHLRSAILRSQISNLNRRTDSKTTQNRYEIITNPRPPTYYMYGHTQNDGRCNKPPVFVAHPFDPGARELYTGSYTDVHIFTDMYIYI